jgi:hypothetical protein
MVAQAYLVAMKYNDKVELRRESPKPLQGLQRILKFHQIAVSSNAWLYFAFLHTS